jgi:hypothetical protein
MTMSPTPTEIAWAAGLFEGEGCITRTISHGITKPRISLGMTDKDVVERFGRIVGLQQIHSMKGPSRQDHWKDCWMWATCKKSEVLRILAMFLPYLGNRRAYKALNALDDIELN